MKDGGEENYISCARSDRESTCIIHWLGSLRNSGEVHLHLRFVKLWGVKCTNSVLLLHFGGLLWELLCGGLLLGSFMHTCEVVFYFNFPKLPFSFSHLFYLPCGFNYLIFQKVTGPALNSSHNPLWFTPVFQCSAA